MFKKLNKKREKCIKIKFYKKVIPKEKSNPKKDEGTGSSDIEDGEQLSSPDRSMDESDKKEDSNVSKNSVSGALEEKTWYFLFENEEKRNEMLTKIYMNTRNKIEQVLYLSHMKSTSA